MTICSQASHCILSRSGCFIYDFQTLLTGIVAIGVAVVAGIPVWRQLKDSNLQARISHRETLANLLRDALQRYAQVDKAIREPMSVADRVTRDPIGEPVGIDPHDAHHVETMLHGVLDWYLVTLKDTEHSEIEAAKAALKPVLDRVVATLGEAHWAGHNDQHDEDHDYSDEAWAEIEARCAAARVEAGERVAEAERALGVLRGAQQQWIQSLRSQIARLDLQIATLR
ncbi:type II secretion system protein [Novosphingobium pokkalii]|uniref:Type II secretion system protein n=2 Tax=Novosphingobium pokkalii TaxID=1770194 RepID=A0ABV7UYH3_9SPHN|nr:hypothetical protein [Novosphingobium pokkalii]GHC97278.1 hypothetical protein GCM10019060_27950 [Novosphingobium pokkalii]